jgi:alpha-tubulin suppressor-like RCC1 family protein
MLDDISTAESLSLSAYHACATTMHGKAQCWGSNAYGQIGNSQKGVSLTPTLPGAPLDVIFLDRYEAPDGIDGD